MALSFSQEVAKISRDRSRMIGFFMIEKYNNSL
jgi:hypothetical protein